MMNKEEMEYAKAFYTKVSKLREDVLKMDWADDKRLQIGGFGGYGYLSNDKILRQISPEFAKHGLEIEKEFFDLQKLEPLDRLTQHWSCQIRVTLVDIDTGYHGTPSTAYGEGADIGDKGINKTQTCADKNWHLKFFGLADGIDPDAETVESIAARAIATKTDTEKEEVRSKVLEAAKKTEVPKAEAGTVKMEPKAETKPAKEEVKTETKPAENKFIPKVPQKKAIDGIIATWTKLAGEGKITPVEYNDMSAASLAISSDKEAVDFIRKYRRSA